MSAQLENFSTEDERWGVGQYSYSIVAFLLEIGHSSRSAKLSDDNVFTMTN
jgi:hypothetical protein